MAAMRFAGMARSYKKSMLYGLFENASLLAIWLTAPSIAALTLGVPAPCLIGNAGQLSAASPARRRVLCLFQHRAGVNRLHGAVVVVMDHLQKLLDLRFGCANRLFHNQPTHALGARWRGQ
mgnify:CR=1 FL=1